MATVEQPEPPKNYRKLRIAWSVGWGILVVMLCLLWERSYLHLDQYLFQVGRCWFEVESLRGRSYWDVNYLKEGDVVENGYFTQTATGYQTSDLRRSALQMLSRCTMKVRTRGFGVSVPIWLPLLLLIVIAAAPWLRWRFRLRTLLIATTLVAVALGLIAYYSRK